MISFARNASIDVSVQPAAQGFGVTVAQHLIAILASDRHPIAFYGNTLSFFSNCKFISSLRIIM